LRNTVYRVDFDLLCEKLTDRKRLPRKLPSLNAVKAFEAVVRSGTTIAAAAELAVTHGAVSRQLQQLEEWIGRPLFKRGGGRLTVTEAGRKYADSAGRALDLIDEATRELLEISDNVVRVSTTPSFAIEWLMPRLPDFQQRHPEIEIWIEEGKEIVDPRSGDCDIAIRMGSGGWSGVEAEPLMNDRLVPVCTPQIAEQLERPRDLARVRLLHDEDPQAQWTRWFEIAAEKMIPTMLRHLKKGARFASSSLLLKAATAGQGVALARERLADQALKTGALVRPFPETVELGAAYWLVTRAGIEPRRPVRIFRAWLKSRV
jgi:LysR family transcriptional regulator, glycine cleavage system transcriptional activator